MKPHLIESFKFCALNREICLHVQVFIQFLQTCFYNLPKQNRNSNNNNKKRSVVLVHIIAQLVIILDHKQQRRAKNRQLKMTQKLTFRIRLIFAFVYLISKNQTMEIQSTEFLSESKYMPLFLFRSFFFLLKSNSISKYGLNLLSS